MSPIFIRPAREQHEHDRLIRHLQSKYAKKFEVIANAGDEQLGPVRLGALTLHPDLVLMSGKKLAGLVEVESAESVNNLEAMAQWVHFANARVPFHLYVPVIAYEAARRLADTYQARITEIWTYRPSVEGFDLVRMHYDAAAAMARSVRPVPSPPPVARPADVTDAKAAKAAKATNKDVKAKAAAAKPAPKPAAKPAKSAKPLKATKAVKARPAAKAVKSSAKPSRAAAPKAGPSPKASAKKKAPAKRPVGKAAAKSAKRKR